MMRRRYFSFDIEVLVIRRIDALSLHNDTAHTARRGADFGVNTPELSVDFSNTMERVNAVRNRSRGGLESWVKNTTDFFNGVASFVDDHTVAVGDTRLPERGPSGDRIVSKRRCAQLSPKRSE